MKKKFYILLGIVAFVIFVLHFRVFVLESYTVPSTSMEKGVRNGAYLLVGKWNYGPRIPITPLSIPFTHSQLLGMKPYTESIQLPYMRLPGTTDVHRNDLFAFNFPEGDTVALINSNTSYYLLLRDIMRRMNLNMEEARNVLQIESEIVYRPIDKKDCYLKRCVALPGDELELKAGRLYINGQRANDPATIQHNYDVLTTTPFNSLWLATNRIESDAPVMASGFTIALRLTDSMALAIAQMPNVKEIKLQEFPKGEYPFTFYGMSDDVFPHSTDFPWTRDNFGPVIIPKAGTSVKLTLTNLPIYERIITAYEKNSLKIVGERIMINDKETDSFTFKMDYYWAMGDNRHNSLDSRYWGFVPEDHVVGKVIFNSTDY